jgi:glyoxalase family protein
VAFSVPAGSFGYWSERLRSGNVVVDEAATRFGEAILGFRDPDGLALEFVAVEDDRREPWSRAQVPAEYAIRGLYGVTLSEEGLERTDKLLVETMGFRRARQQGNRYRYSAPGGGPAGAVDLVCEPDLPPGRMGTGVVHHVAWRAPDAAIQGHFRGAIAAAGLNVTPVMDRTYFQSIYFREPGGVLFEIATDGPGAMVDEPVDRLGMRLALPQWLEGKRGYIEARLPPLRFPEIARGA